MALVLDQRPRIRRQLLQPSSKVDTSAYRNSLFVCLFVCVLFVRLFGCLFFVCLFVCVRVRLSGFVYVCLKIVVGCLLACFSGDRFFPCVFVCVIVCSRACLRCYF